MAFDNAVADSSRPQIVFLHGIASSSRDFEMLKKDLPKDRRVVYIDLLGYGQSPRSKNDYSLEENVRSLRHTLVNLGIRKPIIVGYSMGALISVAYSARYADVGRVICCSMPLFSYENANSLWHHITEKMYGLLAVKQSMTLRLAKFIKIVPNKYSGFDLTRDNWEPFYHNMQNIVGSYNPLEAVKKIQNVTLVVGHIDPFVSQKATREFAKDAGIKDIFITKSLLHSMSSDYARIIIDLISK